VDPVVDSVDNSVFYRTDAPSRYRLDLFADRPRPYRRLNSVAARRGRSTSEGESQLRPLTRVLVTDVIALVTAIAGRTRVPSGVELTCTGSPSAIPSLLQVDAFGGDGPLRLVDAGYPPSRVTGLAGTRVGA
jgi:hypothetical protein